MHLTRVGTQVEELLAGDPIASNSGPGYELCGDEVNDLNEFGLAPADIDAMLAHMNGMTGIEAIKRT